jgi:hypothetical protein
VDERPDWSVKVVLILCAVVEAFLIAFVVYRKMR